MPPFSTHLPELKAYASNREGIENAAVGFDELTLAPNYTLTVGVPGRSAGLAMAERLGVPKEVIQRARQAMGAHAEETAEFLGRLHEKVAELESARAELQQKQEERDEENRRFRRQLEGEQKARIAEIQRRAEERIRHFETEMRAAIQKLDESRESRRLSAETRRQLTKKRNQLRADIQGEAGGTAPAPEPVREVPPDETIPVGSVVRLNSLGATGNVLREISRDRWEVQVGQLRLKVGRDDIGEILDEAAPATPQLAKGNTFQPAEREAASLSEIKVIGQTREEARATVDKFLDDAVVAQVARVRVIHGHGMNTLRNTLWRMFASHPHVERYYQAEQYGRRRGRHHCRSSPLGPYHQPRKKCRGTACRARSTRVCLAREKA